MHNKKLKTLFLCMPMLFSAMICQADFVGVKAGIANWSQEPGGNLRWQGTDADLESGLLLGDDSQGFFWVNFEHPIPGLPNIGLMRTQIGGSGSGTINTSFTFGGTTYNAGDSITSNLEINQTDLILYYELVDIVKVQFDLGLMIKYIDGTAQATNQTSGLTESVDFEGVMPMLYANASFGLPFTGFSVGLEGSAIGYSGHSLVDVRAKVAYRTKAGLGLELGYRRQQLKLDDLDSFSSDLDFSGTYFGVFAKF